MLEVNKEGWMEGQGQQQLLWPGGGTKTEVEVQRKMGT